MPGLGGCAEGYFRKLCALIDDPGAELVVFSRVDDIGAAGDNGHRPVRQCALMGDGINAPRQTRGDQKTRFAERGSKRVGEADTGDRCISCTDDGNRLLL